MCLKGFLWLFLTSSSCLKTRVWCLSWRAVHQSPCYLQFWKVILLSPELWCNELSWKICIPFGCQFMSQLLLFPLSSLLMAWKAKQVMTQMFGLLPPLVKTQRKIVALASPSPGHDTHLQSEPAGKISDPPSLSVTLTCKSISHGFSLE